MANDVVGVVMSGVEPMRVKILLLPEFLERQDQVWNAMVRIPYRKGESFIVGVIVNYRGLNDLYENGTIVKQLSKMNQYQIVRILKEQKECFEADVLLLSAFTQRNGLLYRDKINSPVQIGELVYKLKNEDFLFGKDFYYLGTFYEEDILQPLYIQDFQYLGEAYHFLIAGQSGSGKSTLAMLLTCLYAHASTKNGTPMNFIVLSPVPEFTKAFEGSFVGQFRLNVRKFFEALGYSVELYRRENLAFDRWEILEELFRVKNIFPHLEIKAKDNRNLAASKLRQLLEGKCALKDLFNLSEQKVRELLSQDEFVNYVYKPEDLRMQLRKNILENSTCWDNFWRELREIFELFTESKGRVRVSSLIKTTTESFAYNKDKGKVLIIDIGHDRDKLRLMLLREIVDIIRKEGEAQYRLNPLVNLNTLVILDEAHNFVPARVDGEDEYLEQLKASIVKAYAETRKFGIGWMTITTRLSLIDRKIYEHARVKILGYGLLTGVDRDLLREEFGKEVLDRYSTFSDPADPLLSTRMHAFLIHGPITVFSKTPELIQVFHSAEDFLKWNKFF